MIVSVMANSRRRSTNGSRFGSKPLWTDREKRALVDATQRLRARLKRPLRPADLRKIAVAGRSFSAIKSQARRLGLYEPTRSVRPWTEKERHILVILGEKRQLGARGIKARGFFTRSNSDRQPWPDRSVDSIAQKKRREGLVDPLRSLRAKLAKRLSRDEKRRLRKELGENPRKKTTEDFAREYGVAPSTIRSYRKRWKIAHSWHDAMELPASRRKRKRLAEDTRARNVVLWRQRKEKLLHALERERDRRLKRVGGDRKRITWRRCVKCGREWPAVARFFAPSPKRRGGRVIKKYLKRSCRVCPRRG